MFVQSLTEYIMGWTALPLILLIVGMVLVIIEFITPGLGVPGISGALMLIASMIIRGEFIITLSIIVIVLGVCGFFIFRSFNKGAISRSPIVLNDSINEGSSSLSDADMQSLVGLEGICLTALRPTGNAEIDGKKYDVSTSGEFILKDSRVQVVSVQGLRILVKAV